MIKNLFFNQTHFQLPGRWLTFGIVMMYISLMIMIPLLALLMKGFHLNINQVWSLITSEQVSHATWVSVSTAATAALINGVFGPMVAWVQVRTTYPGKSIINSLIDLPFAIPTAVAGITLTFLFSNEGWVGKLTHAMGFSINYTWWGITLALVFVGLPFVIRSVEPVLADTDGDIEEAAKTLGASPFQVIYRIWLPTIMPAILSGMTVAWARGIGEFGSVVFISGNLPYKTEILPYLIVSKLEQFDYNGATALALLTLIISFLILVLANLLQWWHRKRLGYS